MHVCDCKLFTCIYAGSRFHRPRAGICTQRFNVIKMCPFPKERLNLILDSKIIYDGKCQNITGQGLSDRLCPVPEVSSAMQCSTVTENMKTLFFFLNANQHIIFMIFVI